MLRPPGWGSFLTRSSQKPTASLSHAVQCTPLAAAWGVHFYFLLEVTRFDAKRYRGERLLFHSAIAGLVFVLLAFVITNQIATRWPGAQAWWKGHIPFDYSGTSLLAFTLAALSWFPLNWFFDRDKEAEKAIENWGDFLEMLLNR